MNWKKLLLCVMVCGLLAGCGQQTGSTQPGLDLRTALLEHGGCRFRAVVGADYGDRVYSFTVDCRCTAGGGTALTVLQPEELAGIAATISGDGLTVEFEDAALDFGDLGASNASAVNACQIFNRCWVGAYLSSGGQDGQLERVTYLDGYDEDALTVDTWLDGGIPVYGEITYEGTRCLTVQLSDFQFEDNQ